MESLLSSMAVTSMSQPPTPSLGRRNIQNSLSGDFATSSISQPTTPSLPRRNGCAFSPRDSNPFRVGQADDNKSVFDQTISSSNFATSSPYQTEINDNQQSDWFSSKDHRIAVKSLPKQATEDTQMKNRTDYLNEMSTPTSRLQDQTRSCPLGAHPKNGPPFDHNGQDPNESFCFHGDSVDSPGVSIGQILAVIPTAVISSDNIYLQLSDHAARFDEFQKNLNRCVTLRRVSKIPSKITLKPFSTYWDLIRLNYSYQIISGIGENVLARYSVDEQIYRAEVQFIDRHSLMVRTQKHRHIP